MADHRTLLSTDVHEPKHISDSTSADAGKVITPLSGGLSTLRYLTPADVGITYVYGESGVNANPAVNAFSIPAAVEDPELYNTADYVQLNSVRVPNGTSDQTSNVTFDANTNGLIPLVSGKYRISFSLNVESSTNNVKLGVKVNKGLVWDSYTTKTSVTAIGDTQAMSATIIGDLTAGEVVSLWMASDTAATINVEDFRLAIDLIQGV